MGDQYWACRTYETGAVGTHKFWNEDLWMEMKLRCEMWGCRFNAVSTEEFGKRHRGTPLERQLGEAFI